MKKISLLTILGLVLLPTSLFAQHPYSFDERTAPAVSATRMSVDVTESTYTRTEDPYGAREVIVLPPPPPTLVVGMGKDLAVTPLPREAIELCKKRPDWCSENGRLVDEAREALVSESFAGSHRGMKASTRPGRYSRSHETLSEGD